MKNIKVIKGPEVTLPNNEAIQSDQQYQLPISKKLSTYAQKATVLPQLKSSSLVSLGQLCDNNYQVLLDKKIYMS